MKGKKILTLLLSVPLAFAATASTVHLARPAADAGQTLGVSVSASATEAKSENEKQLTTQEALDAMATVKTANEAAAVLQNSFKDSFYTDLKTADKLYYIDRSTLSNAECNLVLSLQGIVAQDKAEIFLLSDLNKVWMQALKDYYGIEFEEVKGVWTLVNKFKDRLNNNGFVRYTAYDPNEVYLDKPDSSVNIATVISGVERYLLVEDTLVSAAEANGLVERASGNDFFDEMEVFMEYKDRLNMDVMSSLAYNGTNMRDISIALKTMVWRDDDVSDLTYMLQQMNPNGVVLGWHDDEGTGIRASSLGGYGTVFSFCSDNLSVYAGLPKEQLELPPYVKYERKDSTKVHYVTFVQSDGDALSILDRNLPNEYDFFPHKDRGSIPYGWSITPSQAEFSPLFAKWIYDHATPNDSFVGALTASYMFPDMFPQDQLSAYGKRTADYMEALGLKYSTMLFNGDGTEDAAVFKARLKNYSQYDAFKGAFLQYSVDGYLSVKNPGAIYWSDGKPFINYRETMAAPGWGANINLEYDVAEIVAKMAHRINSYKKDATVIEGYTAINVHPWSMGFVPCEQLVGLLDEDVIVVTPNEFMELIYKNVKKVDVMELNDVKTFDYSSMKTYSERRYINLNDIDSKKATDRLSYDFNAGMQGWVPVAGEGPGDAVTYQNLGAGNYGIKLEGVNNTGYMDKVSASIYNKITLPNKESLKMTMSAFVYPKTEMRVQILDANNILHTVYDWTVWESNTAADYVANLSKFAGQTVTISVQYHDYGHTGSMTMLDSLVIE